MQKRVNFFQKVTMNFLAEILEAKLANPKSDRQTLVSKKYDVLECGDVQKVIKKTKFGKR